MYNKQNIFFTVFIFFAVFFSSASFTKAFEIKSDPVYIVVNFSDSFHFLNWSASEAEWQSTVKPVAKKRLENLRNTLFYPRGTGNYVLAWSTLMEYTNYPQDTPSDSSPYILRLKRMMELAEEENFPIFIPLNGFQWWDELPELWNYWDSDGNQTPGCTNANYKKCPFVKLRDPEYRKRFIAGYNPGNKWNVDSRDWDTPMKFVTRNWGGGNIWVAPPANIVSSPHVKNTFAALQAERYTALVNLINQTVSRWDSMGKQNLFVGISIGTEVSLYQSLDPKAAHMSSYGFRAIQDQFCPVADPICGKTKGWTTDQLNSMRYQIMNEYFTNLGIIAHNAGIPKERVYAHSWNEKDGSDNDPSFTNNFAAGITLYTRPAQSLYKLATDPFAFSLISDSLRDAGYPGWAGPEFAPMNRDNAGWSEAFISTFKSMDPPKLIDIYNETDILSTAAIPELKSLLNEPKTTTSLCHVGPSILPSGLVDPFDLTWTALDSNDNATAAELYIWPKGEVPTKITDSTRRYPLTASSTSQQVPKNMEPGIYTWTIKRIGCNNTKWKISNLQTFEIRSWKDRSLKENLIYWYKNLKNKTVF